MHTEFACEYSQIMFTLTWNLLFVVQIIYFVHKIEQNFFNTRNWGSMHSEFACEYIVQSNHDYSTLDFFFCSSQKHHKVFSFWSHGTVGFQSIEIVKKVLHTFDNFFPVYLINGLQKFFSQWLFEIIHIILFEMHMDRLDKSENIFGV